MGAALPGVSRRDFLLASGCTLAGGLVAPAVAAQDEFAAGSLGDAHVHLFNLADLPARGFFEHSVMWNTGLEFWIVRPLWPAMLDMIEFLKSRTITARAELEAYPRDPEAAEDVSEADFRTMAMRRISNMGRQSGRYGGVHVVQAQLSAPQRALRDSYYEFGAWLGLFGLPSVRREPGEVADPHFLDDAAVDRIMMGSRNVFEGGCLESPNTTTNASPLGIIENMLKWARMLMQSRQYHLKTYFERIGNDSLRPRTIVNLLVDYDEWLGDSPAPGSDADAQVALWNRIGTDPERPHGVDIRTFAGFDPLKDVIERHGVGSGGARAGSTTFERNRAHLRARSIHGFKLYPPMGFRPIGNHPDMFDGDRRALRVVRRRLAERQIGWDRLPDLLDGSLDAFYRYCGAGSVPILAHAYHSNDSWHCAAARAGPSGWLDVVERYEGLKICLGHFAESGDFVTAAERRRAGRSVHPRNWPFLGTDRLLAQNAHGKSEVFVDLSDMIEFLHDRRGRHRATRFFRELRSYCGDFDPECRHFMFGTDWIMLEREAQSGIYVDRLRAGMIAAGWPDQWQHNVLHANLQRFLSPHSTRN